MPSPLAPTPILMPPPHHLFLTPIPNPLPSLINSTCHDDATYNFIPEAPDFLPGLVVAEEKGWENHSVVFELTCL